MHEYWYGGWNGFDAVWGVVMGVVWIVVLVWVVRLLVGRRHEAGSAEQPTPLQIAQGRYAKGEITKEQYAELKKELGK